MSVVTINILINNDSLGTVHRSIEVPGSVKDHEVVSKNPEKANETISEIAQSLLDGNKVIIRKGVRLSGKMIKKAVLEVAPQLTFRVIKLGLGLVSIIAI